jgi:quercetin dioxygenase-like cupin family protein
MALEVRRIVTGHDANGKAVIKTDERLPAVSRLGRPHIAGCEIWSTDKMPADNSEAADAAQRKGFVTRYNYVGTGQGTVIRITEFAPGAPKFMHRTETVDYALLLSGECDLELDSGEVAHLEPGDLVVQRGTMHAWVNNGSVPCVFAFILIDASRTASAARSCGRISPGPDLPAFAGEDRAGPPRRHRLDRLRARPDATVAFATAAADYQGSSSPGTPVLSMADPVRAKSFALEAR